MGISLGIRVYDRWQ